MQTDPTYDLEISIVSPSVVLMFVLVGAFFFVSPAKRQEFFPMLKEYPVKLDFNEVARLRENAIRIAARNAEARRRFLAGPDAKPTEIASSNVPSDTPETSSTYTSSTDKSSTDKSSTDKSSTEESSTDKSSTDKSSTDTSTSTNDVPSTNSTAAEIPPENLKDHVPDLSSALAYAPTAPAIPNIGKPTFNPPEPPPKKGKPLKFVKTTLLGVPFYQATVDLKDPEMFLNIELANNADEANSAQSTHGDESFPSFVKRSRAALVQNGTFFSKDNEKRVMGNMVARGRYLKYSQWENYGTTLGIKKNNELEMVTARTEGQPDWSQHWFSLTCGPRLLKNSTVSIDAEAEGFRDSHVLGVGPRCAMGFPATRDKIYIVTFLKGLSLRKEAEVMKAMGCAEAMNLDGGASRSMAHQKDIVVPAQRALTNVIVVYDTNNPAPSNVVASWTAFQQRPDQLTAVGYR